MVSSTEDCICQQGRIELIVQKHGPTCWFFLALPGICPCVTQVRVVLSPADDLVTTGAALQQNQVHPSVKTWDHQIHFPPKAGGEALKIFQEDMSQSTVSTTWINLGETGFEDVTRLCRIFYKQHDKLSLDVSVVAVRNQEPLAQKTPEALNCSIKVYGHPKLSRSAHFRLKFITTHLKAFAELEVTHKTKRHRMCKNHRISTGAKLEKQGTMVGILNVEQVGGVLLELPEGKQRSETGNTWFYYYGLSFCLWLDQRKVEFYSTATNIISVCIQIHPFNTPPGGLIQLTFCPMQFH